MYTAYIGRGYRQFYPCGRSGRTMHPGQNNSLRPLWSVQDKGFIIDLRLIVTLWITRVCTVRYAPALYSPSLSFAFSVYLVSPYRFLFRSTSARLYPPPSFTLSFSLALLVIGVSVHRIACLRSIAHFPVNADRMSRVAMPRNSVLCPCPPPCWISGVSAKIDRPPIP